MDSKQKGRQHDPRREAGTNHLTRGQENPAGSVGSFAQVRNAAQQVAEEEHADSSLRKVTIKRRKKGVASSTKMVFKH